LGERTKKFLLLTNKKEESEKIKKMEEPRISVCSRLSAKRGAGEKPEDREGENYRRG